MLKGYKTYIGIAIAALIALAGVLGIQVPAQEDLPAWLDNIIALAGLALAWYGRRDKERRAPE